MWAFDSTAIIPVSSAVGSFLPTETVRSKDLTAQFPVAEATGLPGLLFAVGFGRLSDTEKVTDEGISYEPYGRDQQEVEGASMTNCK